MSKTYLVDLLRNMIKMVLTRGYKFKEFDEYYNNLSNPEITDDYITEIFGNVHNSGNKELVRSNYLKQYILNQHTIGKESNLRMLLSDYFTKLEPDGTQSMCIVFFSNMDVEGKKLLKASFEQMLSTFNFISQLPDVVPLKSGIFITHSPMADTALASFNSVATFSNITYFTDQDLMFNPTEHVYNAPSRILEGEALENFKKNNINPLLLSRTYTNEPIAKYLGARAGDIIEYQVESIIPGVLVNVEITHKYVRRPLEKKKKAKTQKPKT